MDIAANIRRHREALGISQETAARRVDVALMTWHKWETGGIDIPTSRLPQIAEALGTTPAALVEDE